jgi:hypothetical protein
VSKRVLFIGIGFYDYEESIIKEFQKQNYEVDYFSETPQNSLLYRIYSRLGNSDRIKEIKERHSKNIVDNSNKEYNLIFCIKCESFSTRALELLKEKNPNAKFVLYLWDSIVRIDGIKEKLLYFDQIFTFDRLDAIENENLIFSPLFFREEYLNKEENSNPENDIYHLGWYHTDRLTLLKKVAAYCEDNKLKFTFVLFTGYFSYFIQSIFGGQLKNNKKFLIFKSVSAQTNYENIIKSKVTLDIAHPSQSGLTIRTIELLGAQRKIITTNNDILNYDFYDATNVLIIDRNNPVLNIGFFESPWKPIPKEVILRYSIENWLRRMIE